MRALVLSLVMIVLFAGCHSADQVKTPVAQSQVETPVAQSKGGKQTAISSYELKVVDEIEHTLINNQRFSVHFVCPARFGGCKSLVLHENFLRDDEENANRGTYSLTVKAWRKDHPEALLWTIENQGSEDGKVDEPFYEAIEYGCCGSPDIKAFYSLGTGAYIYLSDQNELLKVTVPNTPTARYIAFHANPAGPTGKLQYGSEDKVMQTVTLKLPEEGMPPDVAVRVTDKPDATAVVLESHDGDRSSKGVSDFSVVLSFEGKEIVVPVENDRLVIEKATLPEGYHFSK